jgi:3-isopropylmalate/(R)-2-methylmalate dehydratase small subunit
MDRFIRLDGLVTLRVVRPDGHAIGFQVDVCRKECRLNGRDDLGLALHHAEKIRELEARRRVEPSWLFA